MTDENVGIASEQDVLRQQISQSRGALAEKLELLEGKVAESVQTATASVAEATASVVESMQSATASVTETVGSVQDAVQGTVESVRSSVSGTVQSMKESLDLSQSVRHYPWQALAGAVAVGFIGGKLLHVGEEKKLGSSQGYGYEPCRSASPPHDDFRSREYDSHIRDSTSGSFAEGRDYGGVPAGMTSGVERFETGRTGRSIPPTDSSPTNGWASQLKEVLQGEVEKLQSLAVGASLGFVRDLISQSVPPQIQPHVHEIINDMTAKLGGRRMSEPFLKPDNSRPEAPR